MLRLLSRGRAGRREKSPRHRGGLPLRARGSVAAGRYRCRIAAARGVVQMDGPVPPGTPIGRLSDTEWGWVFAAMLFAWIGKRAEQATTENLDTERTIRMTALDPQPWDSGAVAAILPELVDACADTVDWSKPLAQWPRETIIEFLLKAMPLIRKAQIASVLSDKGISRQSRAGVIARQGTDTPD